MGYVRASCHQRSGHACFDVRLLKELKREDLLSSCHADLLAARRAISKLLKSNILEIHLQLFAQMGKVWNDLTPKLSCLFASPQSTLTPPRSPQEDGVCSH